MKSLAAIYVAFLLLTTSSYAAVAASWPANIPGVFENVETAIRRSIEKRLPTPVTFSQIFRGVGRILPSLSLPIVPLRLPDSPTFPIGVPNLFGGETNFKLAYGTSEIEFFKMDVVTGSTTETPYEFPEPKNAWNLQSLLMLDASYAWEKWGEDYKNNLGDILSIPVPDYRIKFHENGKTVTVDISLTSRHARVVAEGANEYGAFLSDFGYENLKEGISFIFPRALLD